MYPPPPNQSKHALFICEISRIIACAVNKEYHCYYAWLLLEINTIIGKKTSSINLKTMQDTQISFSTNANQCLIFLAAKKILIYTTVELHQNLSYLNKKKGN
jgi:hypothetical protein